MRKIIHSISTAGGALGALLLFLLMLQQTADVAGRYLFNTPIPGTYERSSILMAVLAALCWGYAQMTKAHVCMDLVVGNMRQTPRAILGIFTTAISLVFFCIVAWRIASSGIMMSDTGRLFPGLNWPVAPFQFLLAVCCVALCLELIVDLIDFFEQVTKRR